MSHFSLMVVTQTKPTQDMIADCLQPYHEFESTGTIDQYVVNQDITEEARTEFSKSTTRFLVDPDGVRHYPYSDEFYREFTEEERKNNPHAMGTGCGDGISWTSKDWEDGQGYRSKVHFIPEGWQDVWVADGEIKTFAQFVDEYYGYKCLFGGVSPTINDKEYHKFGWYRTDAKGEVTEVIKRTNPNRRWDWYTIGGRWAGMITLKEGVPVNAWCGERSRWDDPTPAGRYDSAMKGHIDVEGLRSKRREESAKEYDAVYSAIGQYITPDLLSWEKMVEKHKQNYDAAREEYGAQEAVIKGREYEKSINDHWFSLDDYLMNRDLFLALREISGFSTFAMLKDGNWYARGEMHMWGIVSEEKSQWEFQFEDLFKTIPDDHWITIVDCHI